MKHLNARRWSAVATAVVAIAVGWGTGPSFAQDMAQAESDIDALIDGAANPAGAIAMADTQSAAGDLTGAVATLERALLADPEAHDVRMRYVALLCRLDDVQGARVELSKLDGQPFAEADWAIVQSACGAVSRPVEAATGSGDGITGEFAMGIAYDSDAFGALNLQFDFPGFNPPTDDGLAFVASGRFDGRKQTGSGYLYGGAALQTKDDISGPNADYQIGELTAGYGWSGETSDISLGVVGRHGRINGDAFVSEIGVQAKTAFAMGETSTVAVRGEVVHQDYVGSNAFFSRDGERFDLALFYENRPNTDTAYTIGAAFEHKTADTKSLGYTGGRLFAGLRMPVGAGGAYTNLSSTYRYTKFRDPGFGLARRDHRWFSRAAVGIPVAAIGADAEAAISYTMRDYNKGTFLKDYNSVGAELRLIWTFGK